MIDRNPSEISYENGFKKANFFLSSSDLFIARVKYNYKITPEELNEPEIRNLGIDKLFLSNALIEFSLGLRIYYSYGIYSNITINCVHFYKPNHDFQSILNYVPLQQREEFTNSFHKTYQYFLDNCDELLIPFREFYDLIIKEYFLY